MSIERAYTACEECNRASKMSSKDIFPYRIEAQRALEREIDGNTLNKEIAQRALFACSQQCEDGKDAYITKITRKVLDERRKDFEWGEQH